MAEVRSKKRNANTYTKVSRPMTERGYSRDTEQCCTKKSRSSGKRTKKPGRRTGALGHSPIHAASTVNCMQLWGEGVTPPPPHHCPCIPAKGKLYGARRMSYWRTKSRRRRRRTTTVHRRQAGKSVFPPSQELFLMLDPIASPDSNAGSRTMTLEKALLVQMFQHGPYLLRSRGWSRLEGGKNKLGTTCSPNSCSPPALIGTS
ncbi:uncharacterized protein LOC122455489 [Dermochelys coriacea]|uniref:uncharacterized protein LOC122455489 n=1 Tax=Dermochelys coriacea TaxID=27794 RepID=UPI001CA94D5E|nr:uncharacterized protein LOC122455489 [Dermochelys coriacea]